MADKWEIEVNWIPNTTEGEKKTIMDEIQKILVMAQTNDNMSIVETLTLRQLI
jgi:hypothetical protein